MILLALQEDVGFLPVSEAGTAGRLLGVVTDRDLVVRVIAKGRNPDTTPVSIISSHFELCSALLLTAFAIHR